MSQRLSVNRYLRDKAMDHIDHALGRPLDPMAETYRNHFAACHDSAEAAAFRASPNWAEGEAGSWSGSMAFFYVTDAGRRALREHLAAIADPHRAFVVTFDGYESVVIAKSRSQARYSYWAQVSDTWSELTFAAFLKRARVRTV